MKKILGHLVIPFTDACFSRLRTDDNVNNGYFRIGQIILETRINNSFMIIAKIATAPKEDIGDIATNLATAISPRIHQYIDGLICAGEFLNEITLLVVNANKDVNHSTCCMRLEQCGKCPATKAKGNAEHEARERKYQEMLNSH